MIIRPRAVTPADVYHLLQVLVNRVFGFPNLRAGSTNTRVSVDAFSFAIADQIYSKAAEANIQVTGLTNTSATQLRKVRVELNTAGTVSFKEGAPATNQPSAPIPRRTANRATIGWIEIPASFTYGITAFDAAGVTITNGDPDLGDGAGVHPNDRGIEQTVLNAP